MAAQHPQAMLDTAYVETTALPSCTCTALEVALSLESRCTRDLASKLKMKRELSPHSSSNFMCALFSFHAPDIKSFVDEIMAKREFPLSDRQYCHLK